MLRTLVSAFVAMLCAVLCAVSPARADYPVAPDVVVFCEPTLRSFVAALGAAWRDETGIAVRVFAAPTWANLAQLARGTRDDVIIGQGDGMAASAGAQHLIEPDTLVRLWRNRLVVAARTDAQGSVPADLAGVAGKEPVAVVDPAVDAAGAETEAALQKSGLWDAVRSRSIGVVGTADGVFLLGEGQVKLAVVYASDVAGKGSLTVARTLDADTSGLVYWAAWTHRALSPNTTRFLNYLATPAIRERGRGAGLEVLP